MVFILTEHPQAYVTHALKHVYNLTYVRHKCHSLFYFYHFHVPIFTLTFIAFYFFIILICNSHAEAKYNTASYCKDLNLFWEWLIVFISVFFSILLSEYILQTWYEWQRLKIKFVSINFCHLEKNFANAVKQIQY